jgi:hypothetical protein
MKIWNHLVLTAAALGTALFILASPVAAAPCDGGNHSGNPHCDQDPNPPMNATPELDSAILMGSGLVGAVGYGLMRLRARRQD